jgi:hypothetical protein
LAAPELAEAEKDPRRQFDPEKVRLSLKAMLDDLRAALLRFRGRMAASEPRRLGHSRICDRPVTPSG